VDGDAIAPSSQVWEHPKAPKDMNGGYHVIVGMAGYAPASMRIAPQGRVELTVPLARASGGGGVQTAERPVWPLVIMGAGLAGVVAGGVMAEIAIQSATEAREIRGRLVSVTACSGSPPQYDDCDDLKSAVDRQVVTTNGAAIASAVGGGLALLGGIVYWAKWPTPAKSAGVRVLPWASAQGGGVGVRGSF
jgi:hypothetical protein